MKHILMALTIAGMGLMFTPSAEAACGKKNATIGTIEKYDAETKSLVIKVQSSSDPKEAKAKTAKLSMTPDSKVIAEKGVESLVGKNVTVVSEHSKIDYVIPLAETDG